MALVEGNSRLIYAAKQSAKGTPNTTPTVVFMLSGDGALNPDREIITLPETDASSQRADSRVVGSSPKGTFNFWLRASQFGLVAEGIMGASSGTTTKTATPTKTLPYYTFFDVIPGVQCTQYNDCRFSSVTVGGEAGQGIACSAEVIALEAILGAVEPTLALPTDIDYTYPMVKVTVGGSWPKTHDQFSITINRNVTVLRGDMFSLASFDSVAGLFDVTINARRLYTGDSDYRKVHGGAAAATTLTTDVFSETLSFLIQLDVTHSVEFTSSGIEYDGIAVPVNVDGSPIGQTLTGHTKRQATWSNALTIITKYT